MNHIDKDAYRAFVEQVKEKVYQAQYQALKSVNKELIRLYWEIGQAIVDKQGEHGWGKSVVENLAEELQKEFPGVKGFSVQNLWYMRQFYSEYQGKVKLQPLVGEISWSKHIVIIGKCKDDQEREFYIKMTKKYGWSNIANCLQSPQARTTTTANHPQNIQFTTKLLHFAEQNIAIKARKPEQPTRTTKTPTSNPPTTLLPHSHCLIDRRLCRCGFIEVF